MIRIFKTYLRLMNRKEFKIDEETARHLKELGGVLKILWLNGDAEKSSCWGHPLTEVPPNTHLTIQCELPSHLLEVVNKSGRKITEQSASPPEGWEVIEERDPKAIGTPTKIPCDVAPRAPETFPLAKLTKRYVEMGIWQIRLQFV